MRYVLILFFLSTTSEAGEMLDPHHLREYVVIPVLNYLAYGTNIDNGDHVYDLVLETMAAESGLRYLAQHNGGPALGLIQMEPDTYQWLWHYLYREDKEWLLVKVKRFVTPRAFDSNKLLLEELRINLPLQVIFMRIYYLTKPGAIPKTVSGRSRYWKKNYNTEQGRGTTEHYLKQAQLVHG